jgi:hypothetical protein
MINEKVELPKRKTQQTRKFAMPTLASSTACIIKCSLFLNITPPFQTIDRFSFSKYIVLLCT